MSDSYSFRKSELTKIVLAFIFACLVGSLPFLLVINFLPYNSVKTGYLKENGKRVYVKDNKGQGKQVQSLNVDNDTFLILENKIYAKDKNSVFLGGDMLDDADPNTFEIINNKYGYAKDDKYVYVYHERVIDANPTTFIYLEYPYSKDDKHIYCGTLPMFVKNVEEFKVTTPGKERNGTEINTFIKSNPEYGFIDTKKYPWVTYTYDGKGETKTQKFEGFREVS